MNWVYINTTKLYRWLLPRLIRQPKAKAFVDSFMISFDNLYAKFFKNRIANLYFIEINGQVVKLEKMLNDKYDFVQRRIYLSDGIYTHLEYLYTNAEDRVIYIYDTTPTYLYQTSEQGYGQTSFVINILDAINFNEAELRGLVDTYKLVSKQYSINIIT
ncbi:MAG: hypothetical protein PHW82_08935 [Bacteroidales bacterium]|nr:hypothetical protein [Bacteroidales bacterium]